MSKKVVLRSGPARVRLEALGLTQSALAVICALDVRTVQRWFAGQAVRLAEAERVARVLQMGTADLFDGVPEDEPSGVRALFSLVSRLPGLRAHPAAQLLRSAPALYADFFAPLQFRAHPLRGYVTTFALDARVRHRFIAFRVETRARFTQLQLLIRLGSSVLDERAIVRLQRDDAWLIENHVVRSMYVRRRAKDGSFDLWYWVGMEASELLFVCPEELTLSKIELPDELQARFDMQHPSAEHAVCVRPTTSQIAAAELPRGWDRVAHRDAMRVDVPVPEAEVRQPPRTTPG